VDSGFSSTLSDFFDLVRRRTLTKRKNRKEYCKLGRHLHNHFIAPVNDYLVSRRIKKLVVIPDAWISYIPFEVLIASESEASDFHELDYLIKHYDIQYHYSTTLYLQGRERRYSGPDDFIGFAPVFDQNKRDFFTDRGDPLRSMDSSLLDRSTEANDLVPLMQTEKELAAIVQSFHDRGRPAKGYYRKEASESRIKSLSHHRCLHFATHGIFDEKKPWRSGLAFSTPDKESPENDGFLYAGEIFNLDLDCDLVVLSSCEGGLGKVVKGEGMLALTRGFHYAGVPNLLFSLWRVSDNCTRELMVEFYRQYLKGRPYPEALRLAKLALIERKDTACPNSWGAFVFIGQ
jgi:CHAT domain-containing protein